MRNYNICIYVKYELVNVLNTVLIICQYHIVFSNEFIQFSCGIMLPVTLKEDHISNNNVFGGVCMV